MVLTFAPLTALAVLHGLQSALAKIRASGAIRILLS
jgi:hypothetical protein